MRTAGPNHAALRRGRINIPGRAYLLSTTTRNRARWFVDHDCAAAASRVLSAPVIWRHARLLAWVLMPDHWHGIVVLRAGGSISDCMLRMKSAVAREINARSHRNGPLWRRGFHDRALRNRKEIIAAATYLLANPVRAGIAETAGAYPFWDCEWVGAWCWRI